jgi:archaellin
MSLLRRLNALPRAERGVAGVGVAAIAGAFVLAGSLVAGVVIEGGMTGSEALDATFGRALANVTTGVQVDGPVLARTDGAHATTLLVDITTTPGGGAVLLSPDTAPAGNTPALSPDAAPAGDAPALRVRYVSFDTIAPALPYTVSWLSGDGDALLEPGEVAELAVDVSGVDPPPSENTRFTLELHPGDSAPAIVTRTMPAGRPLDRVINLW